MEYMYELKIPKDRIAIIIGKNGETKKELAEITNTKIEIDSEEGNVVIKGEDAITLYQLKDLIIAIGRGFNPDIAKLLIKQDHMLELINLNDYSRKKNHQQRLKGRVIGEQGKSRRHIEDLTETYISIYGKTIAIIGLPENVSIAKKAIEALLQGSMHTTVFKKLEKKKREINNETINFESF